MEEKALYDADFARITEDILCHPQFLAMRKQSHHGPDNSVYDHSLSVARCAYRMARGMHMEGDRVRAVTRAALLHDFFGYDWRSAQHRRFLARYTGWQRFRHWHPFIHGAHAANRADRIFGLDQRQREAITSHMFPLAPLPRNSEAWVVTLADKLVASREVGRTAWRYLRHPAGHNMPVS